MSVAAAVDPEESEALLTLLLSAHRLSSGFIALAAGEGTTPHRQLVERAPELAAALGELADAAQSRRPPAAGTASTVQPQDEEDAPAPSRKPPSAARKPPPGILKLKSVKPPAS